MQPAVILNVYFFYQLAVVEEVKKKSRLETVPETDSYQKRVFFLQNMLNYKNYKHKQHKWV